MGWIFEAWFYYGDQNISCNFWQNRFFELDTHPNGVVFVFNVQIKTFQVIPSKNIFLNWPPPHLPHPNGYP